MMITFLIKTLLKNYEPRIFLTEKEKQFQVPKKYQDKKYAV